MVEAAFLELGHPSLEQAADLLVARGAAKLVIIPYFLTLGIHMERDLPRLVQSISLKHNGLKIAVTPPLDGHEGLVRILTDRAASALH
jgi:sirohydrochlorin ferrochelatase